MTKRILIFLILASLSACKEAQIDAVCEPVLSRQFNAVYNAHFDGELQLNLSNLCDTAVVYFTETEPTIVLPGEIRSFSVKNELQYLVETSCTDSTLTYQYINKCP